MADDLINRLMQPYGDVDPLRLGGGGWGGPPPRVDLNALMAQPSTADTMAQYQPPAQPWGGLKSYLPDQPDWMRTAQGYLGNALAAAERFSPEAMMLASFLGPRTRASLALSENLQPTLRPDRLTTPDGHPQFYYHILQDGQKIGSATGHVVGDTAHVGWLGATGLDNALGAGGIRQLRDAFRRDFPDVNIFSGDRSSGARAPDIGSKMQADRKQTVRFDDGAGQ